MHQNITYADDVHFFSLHQNPKTPKPQNPMLGLVV